jgi:DivIVA domain-containing protein
MSDFERSGMTFDEPVKRRSPGTWFADLGDRLAGGLRSFDRPRADEPEWEEYDGPEEDTALADGDWPPAHPPTHPATRPTTRSPGRKRFPTTLHGYDREAVDAHLATLERELAELRVRRLPAPVIEDEIERVGEETSAILRVAHEQAAEITRRAQAQAERCVADAAANAVAMTEDAKRKLSHLDSETDAVWAERARLIDDVRTVATALFSLAEDAADRFPEEGDKRGQTAATALTSAAGPATAAAAAAPPAPAAAPPHRTGPPPAPAPAAAATPPQGAPRSPSENRPDGV